MWKRFAKGIAPAEINLLMESSMWLFLIPFLPRQKNQEWNNDSLPSNATSQSERSDGLRGLETGQVGLGPPPTTSVWKVGKGGKMDFSLESIFTGDGMREGYFSRISILQNGALRRPHREPAICPLKEDNLIWKEKAPMSLLSCGFTNWSHTRFWYCHANC